jgi:hypothetical protein
MRGKARSRWPEMAAPFNDRALRSFKVVTP